MQRALRFVEQVVSMIGLVSAVALLPLMIGVRVYEIVMRKLFDAPSALLQYVEWEAFTLLVLLSLGFAYVRNAHVRVDILRERMTPNTRAMVELAGFFLFMLPFALVVIVAGVDYAIDAYQDGERSALAYGRPLRWLIKGALAFGVGLFLVAAATAALRNLRFLRSREGGPAPEDEG